MLLPDHYATLGIERHATADDIKRTYRLLVRRYHPDVSQEPDAEERFKAITEAYGVLSDADRRSAYDVEFRRRAHQQAFQAYFTPGDAAAPAPTAKAEPARAAAAPVRGQDLHAQVQIDLRQAYGGVRKVLSVQRVDQGQAPAAGPSIDLEVDIPGGIRDGQHLVLAGQGEPGRDGGAAGDLYLQVRIQPHPVFRVDGDDVSMDLPISPWEAALGATVSLPTPDGCLQLTLPAGSETGTKLRLRGKGLPASPPGDLFVVLAIVQPAIMTESQREAFEALARAYQGYNPRSALEQLC